MSLSKHELKEAFRSLAEEEPEFIDELLGERFLRNPFPPSEAGKHFVTDPTARISPLAHIEPPAEKSPIMLERVDYRF
jgi:hypothetical protein